MMKKRIDRVNSLIRDLAGQFLLTQTQIKNTIITATRVETSPDLKSAKIFITIFPEKEEDKILGILNRKKREWQRYLSSKFKAKFLPQSRFLIDEGEKSARKVEELLAR